jgi:hypothetical protein
MGVFISYMKSFASLHYQGSSKEVQIDFDRPSLSKFVHELYLHSARKLWQTAYLLNTDVPAETQARNRQEVENVISHCLEQVIRSFLPWQAITKKYFHNSEPEREFVKPVEEEKKNVTFDEDEEEELDEEVKKKLVLSEEDATLDVPETKEVDEMAELEKKASETLVLNL